MEVRSADQFYSVMGAVTKEMLEFGLMDPNSLVKVSFAFIFNTLVSLEHLYVLFVNCVNLYTCSFVTVQVKKMRIDYVYIIYFDTAKQIKLHLNLYRLTASLK